MTNVVCSDATSIVASMTSDEIDCEFIDELRCVFDVAWNLLHQALEIGMGESEYFMKYFNIMFLCGIRLAYMAREL